MSHTYRNKERIGSFKPHYREYLSHKDEPREAGIYDGALAEIDVELMRSSFFEKRRFRRTARRLRRFAT